MNAEIRFFSAVTTETDANEAVADLLSQISEQGTNHQEEVHFDLTLVFLSAHFTYNTRRVLEMLREGLNSKVILGCTAEGIIGREHEIEDKAAISLVAARLPGVNVSPFTLQPTDWPRLLLDPDEFIRAVDALDDTRLFIVLGDPFSTPMDDVLQAFNTNYKGVPVVGGMASGALRPSGNALVLDDYVSNMGAVGVALAGDFGIDIIVSQGCRPIWRPFTVTAAQKNVIFSLEGQPPLAWIQDLIVELTEDDRALLQNGLFVGRSVVPSQPDNLGRGDFLIRGVIGIDRQNGSITIGDSVMEGEIIQFHLRDALTAQEDLEMMLIPQMFRGAPAGALLFSCNGRGSRLYDHPDGDISVIQQSLGGIHLAGFFCAGEIGPIRGENHLHGHTASLAIFRPVNQDQM